MSKKYAFLSMVLIVMLLISGCSTSDSNPASNNDEAYPEKPIKLTLAFGAGGGVDSAFRALASVVPDYLGQPVVIENKPGGSSIPGLTSLLNSKNDGYTLGVMAEQAAAISPAMMKEEWPFDSLGDFEYIIQAVETYNVLAVPADSPFNSLDDMIKYAKENPGKLKLGHSQVGGVHHFTILSLADAAGVDIQPVTFDSSGESAVAVAGGHIDGHISAMVSNIPLLESGEIKLICTFRDSTERDPALPDVPSAQELGYDVNGIQKWGLIAPKGTSPEKIKLLHDAFKEAMESDLFKQLAKKLQINIGYADGQTMKESLTKMYEKNVKLVDTMGLEN